eukprot:SAG22_NODE_245_length_13962_cov_11.954555_4_plen_404_part_00
MNDVIVAMAGGPGGERTSMAPDDCPGSDALLWTRRLARCLGVPGAAGKRWRYAVDGTVLVIVVFETVWWGAVVYYERRQPALCVVGAAVDAVRGTLATVGCGAGALLVARAWLGELLGQCPAGGHEAAAVEAAARRWLLALAVYVGTDTVWMLYRNVASWPIMLLMPGSGGEDEDGDEDDGLPLAERAAIGSSNFVSGAVLLSMQCAFIVVLACACARTKHELKSIDVGSLSAAGLVDAFRDVKKKHDQLLRTFHGSTFLSLLVVYYFLNWSWVFFLIILGELDQAEECIFMASFGRWTTDSVVSVVVAAESLIRRLVRPIVLILIVGKMNNQQPKLLRRLPMAWYKRPAAAAELALSDRCITSEPLAITIAGWHMSIGQASAVVGALAAWGLGESAARWIFD